MLGLNWLTRALVLLICACWFGLEMGTLQLQQLLQCKGLQKVVTAELGFQFPVVLEPDFVRRDINGRLR